MIYGNKSGKIKEVIIEEGITGIVGDVFSACSNLTKIKIPESLTDIEVSCWVSPENLINIEVEKYNPNYSSENGVLFNKNKTKLIKYPRGRIDIEYTIPSSVRSIGDSAF